MWFDGKRQTRRFRSELRLGIQDISHDQTWLQSQQTWPMTEKNWWQLLNCFDRKIAQKQNLWLKGESTLSQKCHKMLWLLAVHWYLRLPEWTYVRRLFYIYCCHDSSGDSVILAYANLLSDWPHELIRVYQEWYTTTFCILEYISLLLFCCMLPTAAAPSPQYTTKHKNIIIIYL